MKKRCLSLLLALVMCLSLGLSLTVPASAANSDFVIENGVLTKYNGPGGDVVIPDGVTKIGRYGIPFIIGFGTSYYGAFQDRTDVTSVTIPDSVTEIDVDAFRSCTGLTSVTIGHSVTSIGYNAFAGCR